MITAKRMSVILKRYECLEESALSTISAYAQIRGDYSGNHISSIVDWGHDGNIVAEGHEYWAHGGHEEHYVSMPTRYIWEGLDEAKALQIVKEAQDAEQAKQGTLNTQKAEIKLLQELQNKYAEVTE